MTAIATASSRRPAIPMKAISKNPSTPPSKARPLSSGKGNDHHFSPTRHEEYRMGMATAFSALNSSREACFAEPEAIAQASAPKSDLEKIQESLREPNEAEARALASAKRRAMGTLNRIIKKLEDDEPGTRDRARLFFGDQIGLDGLLAGFRLIKRTLSNIDTNKSYGVDGRDGDHNTVAFAIVPPSAGIQNPYQMIFLCQPFFESPRHKQANVLIHEAAHIALNIEDVPLADGVGTYGIDRAVLLGRLYPGAAIRNADNWALFVDTWPDKRVDQWSRALPYV